MPPSRTSSTTLVRGPSSSGLGPALAGHPLRAVHLALLSFALIWVCMGASKLWLVRHSLSVIVAGVSHAVPLTTASCGRPQHFVASENISICAVSPTGPFIALPFILHATTLLLQEGATFSDAAAARSPLHVDSRRTLGGHGTPDEHTAAAGRGASGQQADAAVEGGSEGEQPVANELTIIMAVKQRGRKDGGQRGRAASASSGGGRDVQ